MNDPWQRIKPARRPEDLTLSRVDPEHPLDFFRGRDHLGNYVLCYQGRLDSKQDVSLPRFAIIELALDQLKDGSWQLVIRLTDKSHADNFRALCTNLMEATKKLRRGEDDAGIDIIVERLIRWRELLRNLREERLTESQVIGLFGELILLRDVFLEGTSAGEAVDAWRGPHRDEQDFLFGDWLIELKTQLRSSDARLQISSENQLDTASGEILICHQTLAVARRDDTEAHTLNSLVAELVDTLAYASADTADKFRAALIECGYAHRHEYDSEAWKLAQRRYYRVADGFPRITPSTLPSGVAQVQYTIEVGACEEFKVGEGEAKEWVFGK